MWQKGWMFYDMSICTKIMTLRFKKHAIAKKHGFSDIAQQENPPEK